MSIRIADFALWVDGTVSGKAPETFTGVSIDSRRVTPGCLFAALRGDQVDGHRFVVAALNAGASCALVEEGWKSPGSLPVIRVPSPRAALTAAARAYRHTLRGRVCGVTGSAGKTTTKELLAAFLRAGGKTAATEGNLNNDLGLPLSLLNAPSDMDFGVFECGTNHPGEIARLVDILRPHVGLVTSIGTAHIEFFKTQDGIAKEKGTLLAKLPPDGFAVLSRENDRFAMLKAMSAAPVVEVSFKDPSAPFFGRVIDDQAGVLDVREENGVRTILTTGLAGAHNASNCALAFAAARRLGVSAEACARALDGFKLPGSRGRVVARDGVTFVDDSYNANPASMTATLETFAKRPVSGRRIAVLGDMFELGDEAERLHREVAVKAAALPIGFFVLVGPLATAFIAPELKARGKAVECCADVAAVKDLLAAAARPGDAVLLKASHGMALGKILE